MVQPLSLATTALSFLATTSVKLLIFVLMNHVLLQPLSLVLASALTLVQAYSLATTSVELFLSVLMNHPLAQVLSWALVSALASTLTLVQTLSFLASTSVRHILSMPFWLMNQVLPPNFMNYMSYFN